MFITTGVHAILSNINFIFRRSIFIEITSIFIEITYTQLFYIPKQINFHKRSHFRDMLLQLIYLKIYVNISIFEFKIAQKITKK